MIVRVFIACAIALSTGGCAGRIHKPQLRPPVNVPAYTPEQYQKDVEGYRGTTDAVRARVLRDQVIYQVLGEIEVAYRDYESTLFMNRGNFNVAGDFLELGLAAGATIANGERGKTILAAILSGVTGTRLSFDKNFFRERTVEAIISSMQSRRNRIRTRIVQRISNDDTTAYPLDAAKIDLVELFFAGTLQGGLQELHEQSAEEAQRTQAELSRAMAAPASKQDVADATTLNAAIREQLAGDPAKLRAFLTALGVTLTGVETAQDLEREYRTLALRTFTDPAFRKKFFEEARKTNLIQ